MVMEEKSNKIRFRHGVNYSRSQADNSAQNSNETTVVLYDHVSGAEHPPKSTMADTLVSFDCTAKIYFVGGRPPKEHSCHVSLETSNSEPYLSIAGLGVRPRRIKVRTAKSASDDTAFIPYLH